MAKARSDGQKHARITMRLAPLVGLLPLFFAWAYVNNTPLLFYSLWASLAGCLSGLVINPDLDLIGMTDAEWRWMKIPVVGFLLTGIWFIWWAPYAIVLGQGRYPFVHRGLSHWPVLGTLTRVAYLAVPFAAACVYRRWLPGLEVWVPVAWWVIGLIVSDIGHAGRDLYGWEIK